MSRTTNITVTNRTSQTLYYRGESTSEGPVVTLSATSVAPGQSITMDTYNPSTLYGGNEGTVTLGNTQTGTSSLSFTLYYTHPAGTGDSYVSLQSTVGGVIGTDQQTYSGDPITPNVNLYQAAQVEAANGGSASAVPLSSDCYNQTNNCQDFVNSLFGPGMRWSGLVSEKYSQSTSIFQPADFSGQLSRIVSVLYKLWMDGGDSDNPDLQIINFLKGFLGPSNNTPMMLMTPVLTYQPNSSPSVYTLGGYNSASMMEINQSTGIGIQWDGMMVETFLRLLVGGAHFVCISADEDYTNLGMTNPGRDLYSAFTSSGLPQRGDLGNSHYCDSAPVNTTGMYYLSSDMGDYALPGSGLLDALLFGRTVNSLSSTPGTYNTFMQLEGWPAHGLTGGGRHKADYNAYQQTLWNISTFGASVYSEKRGTTVFLAPMSAPGMGRAWSAPVNSTTLMAPYVGAYATGQYPNGTSQPWLNRSLVKVPAGTPAISSAYYVG